MTGIAQGDTARWRGSGSLVGLLEGYGFIAPALALVTIFLLFPIARLIAEGFSAGGSGLAAYGEIIGSAYYQDILLRTFRLSAITAGLCTFVAYPIALRLRSVSARTRGYLNLLFLSPLLVNAVVRAMGWVILLGPTGLEGLISQVLGVDVKLVYSDTGVVIGLADVFLGYMILSLEAGIISIDETLLQAARSLGASELQVLRRVIVPLSLPNMVVGATLVFMLSASTYITPTLLGGSGSQLAAPKVYELAVVLIDFRSAAALVLVLIVGVSIVVGAVSLVLLRGIGRHR